jgi:hypothetical protein
MATRKAYFKAISQEQIDADQASALLSLGSRVSAVETGKADASALASKAEQSYVDSTVGAVDTKVDTKLSISAAAAEYATISALSSKAEQSSLVALEVQKADASVVATHQTDIANLQLGVQSLSTSLNGKAEASSVQQRVAAENAWIGAVRDAIFIESEAGSNVEFNYATLGL